MSHSTMPLPLKAAKATPHKGDNAVSNPRRLKVQEVAAEVGLTPRQLSRLAKAGIPGVQRSTNGYHFAWFDLPETRQWIRERAAHKKGRRKQSAKRKRRLSNVQLLVRALRRTETKLSALANAIEGKVNPSQLAEIEHAGRRLGRFVSNLIALMRVRARHW